MGRRREVGRERGEEGKREGEGGEKEGGGRRGKEERERALYNNNCTCSHLPCHT